MQEEIRNTTEAAKNSSELANNFYSDMRPIVQPVAKCIGALIELAVNPILFYSEKARINYKHRLEQYQKKMEDVKEEDKCEVHPEIGVPIMQVLHYTTNDDIAEMFTNLLTSASIKQTAEYAHPAFVEIIKHMSPDEAKIVKYLKGQVFIPYISLRANYKAPRSGFVTPIVKMVSLDCDLPLIYPKNIMIAISNLLSLGIISDSGSLQLVDDNQYQNIIQKKQLDKVKAIYESMEDIEDVTYIKGYYEVTEIGKLFIKTCCGLPSKNSPTAK